MMATMLTFLFVVDCSWTRNTQRARVLGQATLSSVLSKTTRCIFATSSSQDALRDAMCLKHHVARAVDIELLLDQASAEAIARRVAFPYSWFLTICAQ